jgi:predicted O-methyltransferase YrrM
MCTHSAIGILLLALKRRTFAIAACVVAIFACSFVCGCNDSGGASKEKSPPKETQKSAPVVEKEDFPTPPGVTPGIDAWPKIDDTWKPLTGDKPAYSTDWVTGKTQNWLRYLGNLKKKPNARGLEIGTFEGRSGIWFAQNILTGEGATMTCLDIFGDRLNNYFDHNITVTGVKNRIVKLTGRSNEVLRSLPTDKKFDFIYVDGSHLPVDTLTDIVLSWDLLNIGGVLIVDDYTYSSPRGENPKIACDAFLEIYKPMITDVEVATQMFARKTKQRP